MQHEAAKADKYFAITAGDTAFAVALKDVREVLFIAELSLKSGMPFGVVGYLNRRGAPLAVYDLGLLLSLPQIEMTLYDHILVVNSEAGGTIGLLTSGVKRIIECSPSDLVRLSEAKATTAHSDCLIPQGASFVPVLSLASLDKMISVGHPLPVPNLISPIRAA